MVLFHRAQTPSSKPCQDRSRRRCARLAKKVIHRTPAIEATQNLLMKKIGLSSGTRLETIDFEGYLQMFNDGLSGRQAGMTLELIEGVVAPTEVVLEIQEVG
jgi:hypothetical protein